MHLRIERWDETGAKLGICYYFQSNSIDINTIIFLNFEISFVRCVIAGEAPTISCCSSTSTCGSSLCSVGSCYVTASEAACDGNTGYCTDQVLTETNNGETACCCDTTDCNTADFFQQCTATTAITTTTSTTSRGTTVHNFAPFNFIFLLSIRFIFIDVLLKLASGSIWSYRLNWS